VPDQSLLAAVDDALAIPSWEQCTHQVKTVVINAISRMDRTAHIADTRYFNHSIVPDIVLTWPSEGRRAKRDLYLRLDSSPAYLIEDLAHIGRDQPIVMGLDPLTDPVDDALGASVGDTLVTDALAVADFAAHRGASFGSALPSAMLKGGKGQVDGPRAELLSRLSSDALRAAQEHEPAPISAAQPNLSAYLQGAESRKFFNFVRVIWEATGGTSTDFPLQTDMGVLNPDAFRYLLDEGPEGDLNFWRAVGRTVSLESLLEAKPENAANLRAFVAANLDRLNIRHLMVKADQERLGQDGPEWRVERKSLVLHGSQFRALFSSRKADVIEPPDDAYPISVASFRERAINGNVDRVRFENDRETAVTVDSLSKTVISVDDSIDLLANDQDMRVANVGLLLSGRHINCSITRRMAGGTSGARFSMYDAIRFVLPMLSDLDNVDVYETSSMLRLFEDAASVDALFTLTVDTTSEPLMMELGSSPEARPGAVELPALPELPSPPD
jgi:hypothetical protein